MLTQWLSIAQVRIEWGSQGSQQCGPVAEHDSLQVQRVVPERSLRLGPGSCTGAQVMPTAAAPFSPSPLLPRRLGAAVLGRPSGCSGRTPRPDPGPTFCSLLLCLTAGRAARTGPRSESIAKVPSFHCFRPGRGGVSTTSSNPFTTARGLQPHCTLERIVSCSQTTAASNRLHSQCSAFGLGALQQGYAFSY